MPEIKNNKACTVRPDIHVTRILAKSFLNLDLYKKTAKWLRVGVGVD